MNKTKLELKGLVFYAHHGALKAEAELGQRFKVDVQLSLESGLDFESDHTDATVNYVEVYAVVKEIFVGFRFNLIESCADTICREILERFEKVVEVSVKVEKPSVPVDCICDYFAAEVSRCR